MSTERLLTLVETIPVEMPLPSSDTATGGYMALSPVYGFNVLLRGIPENRIIQANLIHNVYSSRSLRLFSPNSVLTKEDAPFTHMGSFVWGYEDPTVLDPTHNPIQPDSFGFLCTQVFARKYISLSEEDRGAATNLVYVSLDAESYAPRLVMSPQMGMSFGLAPFVDMVKEGEWLPTEKIDHLLIEFGDGKQSSLASARVEDEGVVTESKVFLHASDDQSEHLSTGGGALRLSDSRWLMPINRRRRNNEWGITFMIGEGGTNSERWNLMPEWLIRADESHGRGPGNQLIAFASAFTPIDQYSARVFFHINDNSTYVAIVETIIPFVV